MARPNIYVLAYAKWGSGKSHFAATFPYPNLVLCFDSPQKAMPYLKQGMATGIEDWDYGQFQEVVDPKTGDLRVRIEYYLDEDIENTTAYSRFVERFASIGVEVRAGKWKTVTVDTVTTFELAVRKLEQYRLNPGQAGAKYTKHALQWKAGSTDAVEELILVRLVALGLRCNVVVLAHLDSTQVNALKPSGKDEHFGEMVYSPAMPGRMKTRSGAGPSEVYRLDARLEDGKVVRRVQTQPDGVYDVVSQVEAPDYCANNYAALWDNWDKLA